MKTISYITSVLCVGIATTYYYFTQHYVQQNIGYFLDLAFENSNICVSIVSTVARIHTTKSEQQQTRRTQPSNSETKITNHSTVIFSNKHKATNNNNKDNDACLDIILRTEEGINSLYSLLESRMVDSYINGGIDINWSEDENIYERQMTAFQRLAYQGWGSNSGSNINTFGLVAYIKHIYQHWIAQLISRNYDISYTWIDQHYTDGDIIISSFTDDKYILYSHGIGFKASTFYKNLKKND